VALDGEPRAASGTEDGGGEVRVHAGHDHTTAGRQLHGDPAFHVPAAPWAVDVPEIDPNDLDEACESAEGTPEPLPEMNARIRGDLHASPTNL
jgi:hypothetical protein